MKVIRCGSVRDGDWLGPVCDANAHRSILNYIEIGKKEGKLLTGGGPGPAHGWFIEPTVFVDVSPTAVANAKSLQEEPRSVLLEECGVELGEGPGLVEAARH